MSGKKKDNSWSWRRLRFRERQAFLYIDGKLTMFKKKKKGSDAGDREDNNKRFLRRGSRMNSCTFSIEENCF